MSREKIMPEELGMSYCLRYVQNPDNVQGEACKTIKGISYGAHLDLHEADPRDVRGIVERAIDDIATCQSNCSVYKHHARHGVPEGFKFPCDSASDDLAVIIGGTVSE